MITILTRVRRYLPGLLWRDSWESVCMCVDSLLWQTYTSATIPVFISHGFLPNQLHCFRQHLFYYFILRCTSLRGPWHNLWSIGFCLCLWFWSVPRLLLLVSAYVLHQRKFGILIFPLNSTLVLKVISIKIYLNYVNLNHFFVIEIRVYYRVIFSRLEDGNLFNFIPHIKNDQEYYLFSKKKQNQNKIINLLTNNDATVGRFCGFICIDKRRIWLMPLCWLKRLD